MLFLNTIKKSVQIVTCLFCFLVHSQTDVTFRVTLDAGHGGKDPGTRHHGFIEKDVTLSIVKKLGKLLDSQRDIEVNYTRETDVLIDLAERGYIANRAHAHIFVSIHCNASKNFLAFGPQTFVMGLKKNAKSMEISRRENEVITLEKDYKTKYKGFDPNSPESYIGQTLMQEESLANSIALASKIQLKFTNDLGKKDRGVAQDVFMVLHRATMPRVLVEIGFLSNKAEGEILNTQEGQDQIAQAIGNAIIGYKKEYFDGDEDTNHNVFTYTALKEQSIIDNNASVKTELTIDNTMSDLKINNATILYKIQIISSNKKIELLPQNFKGFNEISLEKEGELYKYFIGNSSDYQEIKALLKAVKLKGFHNGFIVKFLNGEKIP